MSNLITRTVTGKDNAPVYFPTGIAVGNGMTGNINTIGLAGQQGFGVGICPALPSGMSELFGTRDPSSDNYGNYSYTDGSIMVWIPAFVYKFNVNNVSIKSLSDFSSVTTANAAGYALHRMFYNAGNVQAGIFVDKYTVSKNPDAVIASSLKNGNPLSSASEHNPFSLVGAANAFHGALAVAKSRGSKFHCNSIFTQKGLALLSLAHGQAASSNTYCAWYDSAKLTNFPKGCNNDALGDVNDNSLAFISDGYLNCSKTGSANFFAKTTHNGQNNGIADLNGGLWEVGIGLTSDGTNFYLLNSSSNIEACTNGNTLATDLWGAAGISNLYSNIGATYGALTASGSVKQFGSTSQVFDGATAGNAWLATGAGLPLKAENTNEFGGDGLWDYRDNEACAVSGGDWTNGALAGLWGLALNGVRGNSGDAVGCRAALYL
jgi:hypothetical protein